MSDSTSAWLMTGLGTPFQVALVQSAMLLPVLIMTLPAGALADLVDRRHILVVTQVWVCLVAVALALATALDWLTAELLLALTFANGMGMAMRMPVLASLIPELVPRAELGRALALNGVATNGSRIVGPLVAGLLLGWAGGAWVYAVYALMSVAVVVLLARGRSRIRQVSSLPSERFVGAMRLGIQFARQTPQMIAVIVRSSVFSFFAMAVLALLPLVAKERLAGSAGTYSLLLSAAGAGAIAAVTILPRLRKRFTRDRLVAIATVTQAFASLVLAEATQTWLAMTAAFLSGGSWIAVLNAFTVAAQISLPDWVRARGMAVFQVCACAGAVAGTMLWGQLAARYSLEVSLVAAGLGALAALAALAAVARWRVGDGRDVDLTPVKSGYYEFAQGLPVENDQGPVMVSIEYRIDPARAAEFSEVMAESRRWRLRLGAVHWALLRDVSDAGRFVEQFVMESWVDRLRQLERLTAEDIRLRDRKNEFHLGPEPPVMTHYLMETIEK